MLIDCDGCAMRDLACQDCVVTALLGAPPAPVELDEAEQQALTVLAEGGLVPHLQLVPLRRTEPPAGADDDDTGGRDAMCRENRAG